MEVALTGLVNEREVKREIKKRTPSFLNGIIQRRRRPGFKLRNTSRKAHLRKKSRHIRLELTIRN